MNDILRCIKRTGRGLIQILLKNLPGENHKNEERPTQFSRQSVRDLNEASRTQI